MDDVCFTESGFSSGACTPNSENSTSQRSELPSHHPASPSCLNYFNLAEPSSFSEDGNSFIHHSTTDHASLATTVENIHLELASQSEAIEKLKAENAALRAHTIQQDGKLQTTIATQGLQGTTIAAQQGYISNLEHALKLEFNVLKDCVTEMKHYMTERPKKLTAGAVEETSTVSGATYDTDDELTVNTGIVMGQKRCEQCTSCNAEMPGNGGQQRHEGTKKSRIHLQEAPHESTARGEEMKAATEAFAGGTGEVEDSHSIDEATVRNIESMINVLFGHVEEVHEKLAIALSIVDHASTSYDLES